MTQRNSTPVFDRLSDPGNVGALPLAFQKQMADHERERDAERRRAEQSVRMVPIDKIIPNPDQPRRSFDHEAMNTLVRSVMAQGVLQPILVRPMNGSIASGVRWSEGPEKTGLRGLEQEDPDYQIVAGERRWRAARVGGLKELPVLIRDITNAEALEIGVIENDQRENLNPMEEARAYRLLIAHFGYTQKEVGEVVGKSRVYVTNMLRLFQLPEQVQQMLIDGRLSAGHARTLMNAADPLFLAGHIIQHGLSVRAAERLARQMKIDAARLSKQDSDDYGGLMPDPVKCAQLIEDALGLKVTLYDKGAKGHVRVYYGNIHEYQRIAGRLSHAGPHEHLDEYGAPYEDVMDEEE